MAQLIHMRQRIKAIETIKKITHAMRLISMSNHSRLKSKEKPLNYYTTAMIDLFTTIKAATPTWTNPTIYPPATQPNRQLLILIGSKKGLCGNFNTALFRHLELYLQHYKQNSIDYIAIGKKAVDYLIDVPMIAMYKDFSAQNIFTLSRAIVDIIFSATPLYTQVVVLSNKAKTFFVQRPHSTYLIPFPTTSTTSSTTLQEYIWEQESTALLDTLVAQCLETTLQNLLLQSLLAEQAARFLSMDSSTRNAEHLLEATELHYNKLRQAKITKELTELTGSSM